MFRHRTVAAMPKRLAFLCVLTPSDLCELQIGNSVATGKTTSLYLYAGFEL